MKRYIAIVASVIAWSAFAQTEVSSFISGAVEGVTYCLPNTTVEITVKANHITHRPGEFHRYADRFLRISNVISSEESYWEMTDIAVKNSGKPCPEKMYTVKLANNSTASNLKLTDDGILASINCNPLQEDSEEESAMPGNEPIDARQYMTEEILQATSTAKMAELVAKEIYAIRESKLAITRGHADNMPKDGLSMQLVLEELEKQEKAFTELFTGRIDTTIVTRTIKFTPTANSDTVKAIMFRFSRKLGIVDNANLAGAPVYYDFKDMKSVYIPTPEEMEKKKEVKKSGICYNVPGKALLRLYITGKTLYEDELPIAQLGTTEVLSKTLFNKNTATKVVFDTATGAIVSIEKQ